MAKTLDVALWARFFVVPRRLTVLREDIFLKTVNQITLNRYRCKNTFISGFIVNDDIVENEKIIVSNVLINKHIFFEFNVFVNEVVMLTLTLLNNKLQNNTEFIEITIKNHPS